MYSMKRFRSGLLGALFLVLAGVGWAQSQAEAAEQTSTAAAAAVATKVQAAPRTPDFLEHLVDEALKLFDVRSSENTVSHFVIASFFLVGALLLRRVVTGILFS